MTARWGICACLALALALSAGCRTPQPNLKPAAEAEKLDDPPQLSKYAQTGYPNEAFDKPTDPTKQNVMQNPNGGGSRGGMSPGSMGLGPGH